jgi:hypothetical protein
VLTDDQQLFTRYFIENPDIVALDLDTRMFLTTYKEHIPYRKDNQQEFILHPDFSFTYRGQEIGLLHFNNKRSTQFYGMVLQFNRLVNNHLMGDDGEGLMQAIRLCADQKYGAALEVRTFF